VHQLSLVPALCRFPLGIRLNRSASRNGELRNVGRVIPGTVSRFPRVVQIALDRQSIVAQGT
jgi:hypothetical protein